MNKLSIEELKDLRIEAALIENSGVVAALDELIELRGEQVPVAWTDAEELRGMEKDGCGYLFKVDPANPFTDPRRQIMLYDRPQKPVVLRQIGSIDHDGGEYVEYFVEFTDSASLGQAVYVIDSAIEAAGGIVKGGER